LKQFFEEKKFKVKIEKKPANYKIVSFLKHGSDLCDNIEVHIKGKPDDFTIDFTTATDLTTHFIRLGSLTTLIGGGIILRRGIKSKEELEKLEKEFWNFVDITLPLLEQKQVQKESFSRNKKENSHF
jgi:hypothetical protein